MLDRATIEQFAEGVRGHVIQAGDPGYDEARAVWNGMIDRRPALIARCTGTADVIRAVNFGREHDLPLAVKAGGHSYAGHSICEGGLVVDLTLMNAVRIDPNRKRAWVGGGATWGDFDHEAQAFGLATTGGVDSRTGVAGLTLGGGVGYLARSCGLAADNLISADLVTASGERVKASEEENADLFWAIRGGGGNFGVVTSFEFQLHEVGPEVLVAQLFYPFEQVRDVFRFYRDFMADAADELACYGFVLRIPPVAPFPAEYHGKTASALVACYAGSVEAGQAALAPLAAFGDPILKAIQPMPYTALQKSNDAVYPNGARYYLKSHYLTELSDDAIDVLVRHSERQPGALTAPFLEPMGGAASRVDPAATAFPHRDAPFNLGIHTGWTDPADDDKMIAWARRFHDAMKPYATGGVYVNYLDPRFEEDVDERVRAAYGDNYRRLVRVQQAWDPENLFQRYPEHQPSTKAGRGDTA